MTSPYYGGSSRGGYYRPYNEWQAVGSGLRELGRMLGAKQRYGEGVTREDEERQRKLSALEGLPNLPEGAAAALGAGVG